MTATTVYVKPAPDSRLAQLAALYDAAKERADIAAAEFKTITTAIKAELGAATEGAGSIELASASLARPLRMTARMSMRVDTRKLKAEEPAIYDRFTAPVTTWELRQVGGESD